jgi:hypothetical protein
MKVIHHTEFEVDKAAGFKASIGVVAHTKEGLAKIKGLFRQSDEIDRLPARLLRDAAIDELEIERRRLANASMIR